MISVFVPIKKYISSKDRLSSILDESARAELAEAMAKKTIAALVDSQAFERIVVVTNDPTIFIEGAEIFVSELNLNAALLESVKSYEPDDRIMFIHADLPMINKDEINKLQLAFKKGEVLIIPDIHGAGTNCLIFDSKQQFKLCFGPNSFNLFVSEFSSNGYAWSTYLSEPMQRDLDSEDDYFKLKDYIRD